MNLPSVSKVSVIQEAFLILVFLETHFCLNQGYYMLLFSLRNFWEISFYKFQQYVTCSGVSREGATFGPRGPSTWNVLSQRPGYIPTFTGLQVLETWLRFWAFILFQIQTCEHLSNWKRNEVMLSSLGFWKNMQKRKFSNFHFLITMK